ncbi:MAG: hypothetical protein U0X75_17780 [Acidobacteriota bacterium]
MLTRFKERRVRCSKESRLRPVNTNGARALLRELRGRKLPDAKIRVEVEDISATTVALIFNVEEGSRVRVKISFTGDRDGFSPLIRGAMKLVKEAG